EREDVVGPVPEEGRRDRLAPEAREEHEDEDDPAHHCEPVALEASPDELPVAPGDRLAGPDRARRPAGELFRADTHRRPSSLALRLREQDRGSEALRQGHDETD